MAIHHERPHFCFRPVPQVSTLLEIPLRRECLYWAIPLSEGHLRSLLKMWSTYYNRGRPHMALGPGVPDPPRGVPAPLRPHRHPLSASPAVVAKPVLNGLHHDYRLAPCPP